ncbi:MAG: hypothetical protein A2284_06570 [Deltaproteobacteria bacterium RIFOXYA12_FULL_61_11]|nr:MAG: hypothetical protein A2284_06570 [Deltaproteobacteria bacterium RIFOXYA12_FULL_61_11]
MATLIDGKRVAQEVRDHLHAQVSALDPLARPCLTVILIGDDPASAVYVRTKERACAALGFRSSTHRLSKETTQQQLHALLDETGSDPKVHGILLQLPLPGHLCPEDAFLHLPPGKDVDGLHPLNQARLLANRQGFVPCTPLGILHLLRAYEIPLRGRRCCVLGRSLLVGKPTAALLTNHDATVTLCHSKTEELPAIIGEADLVVACLGKPHFVRGAWLRPGATVIDVGINRLDNGTLCGDVVLDEALSRCSFITPVPGGVGPMTVAMLLSNTYEAWRQASNSEDLG